MQVFKVKISYRDSLVKIGTAYSHISDKLILKYVEEKISEQPQDDDKVDYTAKNIAYLVGELKRGGRFFSDPEIYKLDDEKWGVNDGCHRIRAYQVLQMDFICDTYE
jgi:hypothetical protein